MWSMANFYLVCNSNHSACKFFIWFQSNLPPNLSSPTETALTNKQVSLLHLMMKLHLSPIFLQKTQQIKTFLQVGSSSHAAIWWQQFSWDPGKIVENHGGHWQNILGRWDTWLGLHPTCSYYPFESCGWTNHRQHSFCWKQKKFQQWQP